MKASEISDDWLLYYLEKAGPIDVHLDSTWPHITDALTKITEEVIEYRKAAGHQIQHPNRLSRYLKVVILDILVATVEGESPFRYISLNKASYRQGMRLEKIHLGSYLTAKAVVDSLHALDYIYFYPGWFTKQGKTRRTRIAATDKLLNTVPFDIEEISYDWLGLSLVQLKHEGKHIDFTETPYSQAVSQMLFQYNSLAEKTDIRIDGIPVIKKYQYSVFHGKDINSAVLGRMYGGTLQNLKKDRRNNLTIWGERLMNLDFKSHHIRMAYHLAGLNPAFDPYLIEGFTRDEVKSAVNIMLNCESRDQAIKAVASKKLVEAIEAVHPILCRYNAFGKKLQKEDSDLMRHILARLVDMEIYVINLHDGVLCRESDMELVLPIMNDEYVNRFGKEPIINISI